MTPGSPQVETSFFKEIRWWRVTESEIGERMAAVSHRDASSLDDRDRIRQSNDVIKEQLKKKMREINKLKDIREKRNRRHPTNVRCPFSLIRFFR